MCILIKVEDQSPTTMDVQQKRDAVESPKSQSPINKASSSSSSPSPTNNENNLHDCHYSEGHVSKYPVGYRFQPNDDELVGYYLRKKVANHNLPINMTANEVQLYRYNPQYLAENYEAQGDNVWYLFTPRDRKYPNGERPNRAAGDGYWKATGADKPVVSNGLKIGFKKSLVFYQGKPPGGVKSDWIMHEYRLNQPPKQKGFGNDMRLDDWVLCRLYKKPNKKPLTNEKRKVEDVHDDHANKSGIVEEDDHKPVNKSGIDQTSISTIHDPATNQNHHVNDSAYPHNHTTVYDPHQQTNYRHDSFMDQPEIEPEDCYFGYQHHDDDYDLSTLFDC